MDDAAVSDDSSFYGDEEYVAQLEKRASEIDIQDYWQIHARLPNVIFNQSAANMAPSVPKGGLHNRYEGVESAWQLHETVDDFLARLPVLSSSQVGPWLWVANPYADRNAAAPDERDATFMQRAPRLLSEYLDQKSQVTRDNPSAVPGTITRRLKPAREKLKNDILALAKSAGLTSGKWMLFPGEAEAPAVWRQVVTAVLDDKLGTAAKISTQGDTRLVCVYTSDFSDEVDVRRVVQSMDQLGLVPRGRSIYYKCDAYTYLDIGAQNDYGLQASLYASKDLLEEKNVARASAPVRRAARGRKKY